MAVAATAVSRRMPLVICWTTFLPLWPRAADMVISWSVVRGMSVLRSWIYPRRAS